MNQAPAPRSVIPLRYVESVDAMRDFYINTLGFEHLMGMVGNDGQLDFGIVQRHGAMLMLARAPSADAVTGGALEIYVEVEDVGGYHDALASRGIALAEPLVDQWWGDRNFAITDPAGHKIWFYQTVAEIQPPPGVKLV